MSLQVQIQTMYMMLLSGLAMGVIFDAYRVVCTEFRVFRWIISLVDLVYWIAATLLVFFALYSSNQGQVRLYVFIGLFIGIWFYFYVFSSTIIRIVVWLIRKVKQLAILVWKLFNVLVLKPLYLLYRGILVFLGFLAAISMFLFKIMLQLFYPLWKGLRGLFRLTLKKLPRPHWLGRWVSKFRSWLKR